MRPWFPWFLGLLPVLALCASIAFADGIAGPARVVDGDTLVVGGRVIDLAAIDAPDMGQRCVRGGSQLDCGVVARSQLMDLTAGTHVECDANGWCASDGYDLSENMLHTGWAIAGAGASDAMLRRQAQAREGGRGLWGYTLAPSAE